MDDSGDHTSESGPNVLAEGYKAVAPVMSDASGVEPAASDQLESVQGGSLPNASFRGDLVNVARGFCMGAADSVPGVSGGTIALVLGHYRRLITAISHFDTTFISLLLKRDFRTAAARIDLRFLIALAIGILTGIVLLLSTMHWLMDHRMSETMSVFLGLMLASVWLVKGYVEKWSPVIVLALMAGIASAVIITLLPTSTADPSLPFLFIAAAVAICAMILPGISGAFVLLLLGVYQPISGLIKEAARGNITSEGLIQITIFASGCAIGLLAFSRGLRWMLDRHQSPTMAALMGLMIGSLGKLWPLQEATPETAQLESKFRVMQYISPAEYAGSIAWLITLAILAAVAVLVIEKIAERTASD
ncbi:MAG: DUF368 domain-containing protein [Planctomycetota bacterium]